MTATDQTPAPAMHVVTYAVSLADVRAQPLESLAVTVEAALAELASRGIDPATLDLTVRAESIAPKLPPSTIVVRARALEARP